MKYIHNVISVKKFKAFAYIALSAVFLLSACSKDTSGQPSAPTSVSPSPTLSASPEPTATAAPVPTLSYTIATVTSTQDGNFAYIKAGESEDSEVLGAAEEGVDLAVTLQDGGWCRIVFDGGDAFIQSKYITIKPDNGPLPEQKICAYSPAKQETGLVETKYNNKLKVVDVEYVENEVTKHRLDIYTTGGVLLVRDASIELTDATITAAAIEEPEPEATPGAEDTQEPDPSADPSAEPSDTPSSAPAPVPVNIIIKSGKVKTCEGIMLEKDSSFDAEKQWGKVIAKDKTVIEQAGALIEGATIKATKGYIYYKGGYVELQSDYYLVPAKLTDNLVDVSRYGEKGITINMLFARDGNLLGDAIYERETCLLQKNTLEKLNEAEKKFEADGYSIIIYDAYRPSSVTEALYEKYKDGNYVAPPRFGSVHNKGAAIDMSLLDSNSIPIEMPSPIHTLDETANRDNKNMTAQAKANMDYMAGVMESCGFTTIETEWWHFSDSDAMKYLRTDLNLDSLLRVVYK